MNRDALAPGPGTLLQVVKIWKDPRGFYGVLYPEMLNSMKHPYEKKRRTRIFRVPLLRVTERRRLL